MDFDAVQSRTMAIPIRTMAYSLLCRSTLQPRLQLRLHETGRLAIASFELSVGCPSGFDRGS